MNSLLIAFTKEAAVVKKNNLSPLPITVFSKKAVGRTELLAGSCLVLALSACAGPQDPPATPQILAGTTVIVQPNL